MTSIGDNPKAWSQEIFARLTHVRSTDPSSFPTYWTNVLGDAGQRLDQYLHNEDPASQVLGIEAIQWFLRHAATDPVYLEAFSKLCALAFRRLGFMSLDTRENASVRVFSSNSAMAVYGTWLSVLERDVLIIDFILAEGGSGAHGGSQTYQIIGAFLMLNYLLRFAAMPEAPGTESESKVLSQTELRILQGIALRDRSVLLVPMAVIAAHVSGLFLQNHGSATEDSTPLINIQQFLNMFFNVGNLPIPLEGKSELIVLEATDMSRWRGTLLSYSEAELERKGFKLSPACFTRDMLFIDFIFSEYCSVMIQYEPGGPVFVKSAKGPSHRPEQHYSWLSRVTEQFILSYPGHDASVLGRLAAYCSLLQDSFVRHLQPKCCIMGELPPRLAMLVFTGVKRDGQAAKNSVHDFIIWEFTRFMSSFGEDSIRASRVSQTLTEYLTLALQGPVVSFWSSCSASLVETMGQQYLQWVRTAKGNPRASPLYLAYQHSLASHTALDGPYQIPWHVSLLPAAVGELDAHMLVSTSELGTSFMRFLEGLEITCNQSAKRHGAVKDALRIVLQRDRALVSFGALDSGKVTNTLRLLEEILAANCENFPGLVRLWAETFGRSIRPSNVNKHALVETLSIKGSPSIPLPGVNPLYFEWLVRKVPSDGAHRSLIVGQAVDTWAQAAQDLPLPAFQAHLGDLAAAYLPSTEQRIFEITVTTFIRLYPAFTDCVITIVLRELRAPDSALYRAFLDMFTLSTNMPTSEETLDVRILKDALRRIATVRRTDVIHWAVDCVRATSNHVRHVILTWLLAFSEGLSSRGVTVDSGVKSQDMTWLLDHIANSRNAGPLLDIIIPRSISKDGKLQAAWFSRATAITPAIKAYLRDSESRQLIKLIKGWVSVSGNDEQSGLLRHILNVALDETKENKWFWTCFVEPIVQAAVLDPSSAGASIVGDLFGDPIWVARLLLDADLAGLTEFVRALSEARGDPKHIFEIWKVKWRDCSLAWLIALVRLYPIASPSVCEFFRDFIAEWFLAAPPTQKIDTFRELINTFTQTSSLAYGSLFQNVVDFTRQDPPDLALEKQLWTVMHQNLVGAFLKASKSKANVGPLLEVFKLLTYTLETRESYAQTFLTAPDFMHLFIESLGLDSVWPVALDLLIRLYPVTPDKVGHQLEGLDSYLSAVVELLDSVPDEAGSKALQLLHALLVASTDRSRFLRTLHNEIISRLMLVSEDAYPAQLLLALRDMCAADASSCDTLLRSLARLCSRSTSRAQKDQLINLLADIVSTSKPFDVRTNLLSLMRSADTDMPIPTTVAECRLLLACARTGICVEEVMSYLPGIIESITADDRELSRSCRELLCSLEEIFETAEGRAAWNKRMTTTLSFAPLRSTIRGQLLQKECDEDNLAKKELLRLAIVELAA
ncbi:hypothetical protein HDU85_001334 [Gaertneriomyces sp. JEL0708]|nr:hypothetical protein HDU85_001334 [Gaertneriomyces sp. JEL0708]